MFFRSELAAMSTAECAQYVKFRLMVAGRIQPLFTEDGLLAIQECTGGISRSINKLGMMCLLEGCSQQLAALTGAFVKQCAEDM